MPDSCEGKSTGMSRRKAILSIAGLAGVFAFNGGSVFAETLGEKDEEGQRQIHSLVIYLSKVQ
jgi:hypothetical protein